MDKKLDLEYHPTHQDPHALYHRDMPNPRLPRSRRLLIVVLSLLLPTFVLFRFLGFPSSINCTRKSSLGGDKTLVAQNNVSLVPLEAHIMSKCPDARDCLRDLVVPAMEKIADKVDFRLSFIGT